MLDRRRFVATSLAIAALRAATPGAVAEGTPPAAAAVAGPMLLDRSVVGGEVGPDLIVAAADGSFLHRIPAADAIGTDPIPAGKGVLLRTLDGVAFVDARTGTRRPLPLPIGADGGWAFFEGGDGVAPSLVDLPR